MDRADRRSSQAATWASTTPHVALNAHAVPFTMGKVEEKKWLREKNGRKVLRIRQPGRKDRYWRAPCPRPRQNRRQKRREKTKVLKAAMSQDTQVEMATDPAMAIQVLQVALRASLLREERLKRQLAQHEEKAKVSSRARANTGEERATNAAVPQKDEAAAGADDNVMAAEERQGSQESHPDANQDTMKYVHILVMMCAILAMFAQSWWYRILFLLMMFWLATVGT